MSSDGGGILEGMVFPLVGAPPPLRSCALTWLQLYETGCFFQRELVPESELGNEARKRGFTMSQVARERWEHWDELGVVRPIGFSQTAYSGAGAPAIPFGYIVFRDECEQFEPWDSYAWDASGYPHVSALFSPWQILVVPDAIDGGTVRVPLELLAEGSGSPQWGESPRAFFRSQYEQWTHLHEWWDPTLRLLVRLQNRYWPEVLGRVVVVPGEDGEWRDPRSLVEFDPHAVLDELAVTAADIAEAYRHLARRGDDLEYGDGAYLLRQMFPRPRRRWFEKGARRAQDFYDAAEVLRRFYRDITGETLADPQLAAGAHTDEEVAIFGQRREKLLGHAPRLRYDAEDVKRVLGSLGIYPHGVHVIVEGETEEDLVVGMIERGRVWRSRT